MNLNSKIITDIEFPNGTLRDIELIICKNLSHDLILGCSALRKFSIDLDEGTALIQDIPVDLIHQGTEITCSLAEELTVEPEAYTKIHFRSPLPYDILEEESAIILQNLEKGYLAENDLFVVPGVYENSEIIEAYIFNPNPYSITIPPNIPVVAGSTLNTSNGRLESNELIEVRDDPDHALSFLQHQEFRRRKFDPENSDSISKIEIGKLNESDKAGLDQVLARNKFAFSVSDSDIGLIRDYQFGITWKDNDAEVYHKPRPVVPAMREKANEKIEAWREMGVIEPSSSRNNIPLFFIKKGTKGDIRPILDCRGVNHETIANRFPIPHLKDLLSNISRLIGTHGKNELFISTTDIQSAFTQLIVRKDDRPKCAFSYNNRQWQAARCLFGLRNAPSAFCEVMARILDGLENVFVLLDDVLIISTDWDDHLRTLDEFLNRCIEHGITLKPSKTYLAAESIDYLGFRLSRNGIEPLKAKVDPILQYPLPKTRRQLRRFVGMTNFYSRFVQNSSLLLAPLYKLCGASKVPYRLTQDHISAFERYKTALAKFVQLSHRDDSKRLVLITDASNEGMAGALHQADTEGRLEPLGFVSRALKPAEERLASRYQEFLGLVWALEQFSWELLGQHVLVVTDHFSLTKILEEKEHKEHQPIRVINAHARLSRFNVDIVHRRNTDEGIIAVDALSRAIPLSRDTEHDENEDIIDRGFCNAINLRDYARTEHDEVFLKLSELSYSYRDIRKLQNDDPEIQKILDRGNCETNNRDLLVSKKENSRGLVLVPQKLARELISFVHATMGHPGREKLIIILRRAFVIHNVHVLANEICTSCEECIIVKPRRSLKHPNPPAPDIAIKPWDRFYIDLTDFGHRDDYDNRYFLGIMDHATRFIDGVPLRTKNAEEVAIGLANLFCRHNCMSKKCVMDNGMEFRAKITEYLFKNFGIAISHISPHNPVGNLIERSWRELGIKAKLQNLERGTWSRDIPLLLFQMNNTPHEKLEGLTPAEILTGQPLLLSCFEPNIDEDRAFDEYSWVGYISRWLRNIGSSLGSKQAERHENPLKSNHQAQELKIGDRVAFWSPQRPDCSKKLFRHFGGIGIISKIGPNGSYELVDERDRHLIRNIKYLRLLPEINNP